MSDLDYGIKAVNEFYKRAEEAGYFEDRRLHQIVKENLVKIASTDLPNESIDVLIQMVDTLCINHKDWSIDKLVLEAKQEHIMRALHKDTDAFINDMKESIERAGNKYSQKEQTEDNGIKLENQASEETSLKNKREYLDDVNKNSKDYLHEMIDYVSRLIKRNTNTLRDNGLDLLRKE